MNRNSAVFRDDYEDETSIGADIEEGLSVDEQSRPKSLAEDPTAEELENYGCTYIVYLDGNKKNPPSMLLDELKEFIFVNFNKIQPKTPTGELVTKIVAITRHQTPQRHILYEKEKREKGTRRVIHRYWWRS